MLRFANTVTYFYEHNLCDCLRPRATRHEPFGPEPVESLQVERLTAEGLVDMSQTEGLTQHLVLRATTETCRRAHVESLSRSLNKYVIEFMNRGTKAPFYYGYEAVQ